MSDRILDAGMTVLTVTLRGLVDIRIANVRQSAGPMAESGCR